MKGKRVRAVGRREEGVGKSFIESTGWVYPGALICKICSFEKLTRNSGGK